MTPAPSLAAQAARWKNKAMDAMASPRHYAPHRRLRVHRPGSRLRDRGPAHEARAQPFVSEANTIDDPLKDDQEATP